MVDEKIDPAHARVSSPRRWQAPARRGRHENIHCSSDREQVAESHARGPRRAILRLLASYPQRWSARALSHARTVPTDALTILEKAGGFATTAQLLTVMTRQQLDVQVKNGGLVRVWYRVYAAQSRTCWAAWRLSMCS